ncbi:hypothetical protein FKM82_008002 [Ascaphus truei]
MIFCISGVSVSVCAGYSTVLKCGNDPGDSLLMITWKVDLLYNSHCILASEIEENKTHSNCSKRLSFKQDNLSLRIDDSKIIDEGNYTCEFVSDKGTFINVITLNVLVQPLVTLEINRFGFPECKALRGNPAANISWMPTAEHLTTTNRNMEPDNTWTVISTYGRERVNVTEVTCVVFHPTFAHPQNKSITTNTTAPLDTNIIWCVAVPIVSIIIIIIVLCMWKQSHLRTCFNMENRNTATIQPQGNNEEDREEVEPYASYTEKVNTIYCTM